MKRATASSILAFSAVLLCSLPAAAQEFKKENFNYSEFAKGAFSEAVTVTGPSKLIFLAGIGSEDPNDGSVKHAGDFLEQCRMAWAKAKKALEANGATIGDIVKVTSYLTDVRYRDEFRSCRSEALKGFPLPPHTFVNVSQLARPGMMYEVDIIAAVPASK